jgi:exodeoxyribonuclease V gamma subunit
MLELREPSRATYVFSAADVSMQIHSCHSAMREIEVLHDQLLALFQRHSDLAPSDVVVMTPDIETYAPYIESVFATAEPRIPYNVSDRSGEKESTLAATLLALLELGGSRYDAQRVLATLDEASVRRRFDLSEGDVETARRWVREAQVRWGIDAEHRSTFGLPATHEHTWRFGLDRLLLGYALPSGEERLFEGVLAYDEIEGSLGSVLGHFVSYVEAAIALDTDLAGSRSIARWCEVLQGVLARFFDAPEERAEELEAIRAAVGSVDREARLARFSDPVPFTLMLTVLRERLEVPARAFLSGGVTFCAMVPMRSLPFEVVCMIGMNDRAYPRIQRRESFDLMASDFRQGDRARREDDRYLFLESVVNARRCLYMSYTGRHIREDTVIPPSVLVSELLDYVERGYSTDDETSVRSALVTEHPLQAFSKNYFSGDGKLFSYSDAFARAASAAGRGTRRSQPFLTRNLPPLDAIERRIDLDTLVRFFRNPARHLFEQRLHVRLEASEDELLSREPFELEDLPLYRLKEHLLEMQLDGRHADAVELARASGVLPHGRMGEILFEGQNAAVEAVAARARAFTGSEPIESLFFEFSADEVTLTGTLTRVTREGMLVYRVAKMNASVRVAAWLRHLALNAFPPPGAERVSRCIAQDCVLTLQPVDDARERLTELLALYWTGMHRALPFFPRTAFQRAKGAAEYQVRNTWTAFSGGGGECSDAYFALAFRGVENPLDAEFDEIAHTVFRPLLAASVEEPLA